MASIGSLMGASASSSIYGSRNSNIISGLASGLDTESMIEGMVQGYKQKITGLGQDRTKLLWKQEAYQSISDKLVEFSRKYMSFNSGTNILSNSFFNNSVITTTGGKYADKITATGKTSSNVVINGVSQLATTSRYTAVNKLGGSNGTSATGSAITMGKETTLSTLQGSLTLSYGTQQISVRFGENDLFQNEDGKLDVEKLKESINKQLDEQRIKVGDNTYKASDLIDMEISAEGEVTLKDKLGSGNRVSISNASGGFKSFVKDYDNAVKNEAESFNLNMTKKASKQVDTLTYLSEKSFTVTLNDQTKTFTLSDLAGKTASSDEEVAEIVADSLQSAIDQAFGGGKLTVSFDKEKNQFSVSGREGDLFSVSSSANTPMGFPTGGLTSYLDTGRTLGDLLGTSVVNVGGKEINALNGLEAVKGVGKITEKDGAWTDEAGNLVDADGYRINAAGDRYYSLTINGKVIGNSYTKDTAMDTVINDINNNTEAGVNVIYSRSSNQFVFTAKESGAGREINIDTTSGLGKALFGEDVAANHTAGQDAELTATINGETVHLKRNTNTFTIDGMTVTVNGTFDAVTQKDENGDDKLDSMGRPLVEGSEGVSFTTKADTDSIVDAIKSMVTDYNAIITEVKKAYSDQPLTQGSSRKPYEPLTDEDREGMSESEIKAYEEKAKTGILFMDRDLSSLYNSLRSTITPGGSDGSFLRSIGIETDYSDGLTTIKLDEQKLRTALEANPDQVRDAFTKTKENGAETDGLMSKIRQVTERYAGTTGDVKGILIEKAGSKYSPTAALDNSILNQMKEIDKQIDRWQDKMSDRVDYYTNKFTQLEVLIQQMNSQSSSLAGLMGGGGGY